MADYAEKVLFIGGGRWSRVLLKVFLNKTNKSTIFYVYSNHMAYKMTSWINKIGFGDRISVVKNFPNLRQLEFSCAVIVNRARHHKKYAALALRAGIPVLIEKPTTLSLKDTNSLWEIARSSNTFFMFDC